MTDRNLTIPLPGSRPATLTLPEPLNADAVQVLDDALACVVDHLRRDYAAGKLAAGHIEYASWIARLNA